MLFEKPSVHRLKSSYTICLTRAKRCMARCSPRLAERELSYIPTTRVLFTGACAGRAPAAGAEAGCGRVPAEIRRRTQASEGSALNNRCHAWALLLAQVSYHLVSHSCF